MQNITVILVQPQMGENIGAAARAMLNFGISDLRLVAPRDGWPNERATAMAAGAFETMPDVQVFDGLKDAITDCHICMATTARARGMVKPVQTAHEAAQSSIAPYESGERIALIFGAERAGLSNDDIALCQSMITIPTNPEFSSLNLGQGVLLIAYEFWQALRDKTTSAPSCNNTPAPQEKLEGFLSRLETELETHDFFKSPDLKPTILRSVRNMFVRGGLTEQEVRTLHGILSAFTK